MGLSSIFFDEDHNEERWFDDVKTYIDDKHSLLEKSRLYIDYEPKSKNHQLIGNMPFISCQVLYWKEQSQSVEITKSYEDVCACDFMCFGQSDSEDGSLTFQL